MKLLMLDPLLRLTRRNLLPRGQHAVLQRQHLAQQVVQEGGREPNPVRVRRGRQPDLQLARRFVRLDGLCFCRLFLSVRGRLPSELSRKEGRFFLRSLDKGDVLGHFGDAVRDARGHDLEG
jgi:hypothetical protein